MIRILVADDHPIFRKGLIEILHSQLDCDIVEVENGAQVLEQLETIVVDVCILDVDMPVLSGLEACEAIQEKNIPTRVIFLTMFKDSDIFHKALTLGAHGFLLKDQSGGELVECIQQVVAGQQFIGKGLHEKLQEHQSYLKKKKEIATYFASLTKAEMKTLKLVAENNSSKEIADKLFLSPKTVENYRSRIARKLNLPPENNSLVKWALENKKLLKDL